MISDDERWMRESIRVATHKGPDPEKSPIGAVLVRDGRLTASGCNRTDDGIDATARAEMVTFRESAKADGAPDVSVATLYSTLQPLGMCMMATI